MDFQQVVEQRRAVREYLDTPVAASLIAQMIETATLAPSAMNRQPWSFAVVSGTNRIDACAQRAKEYALRQTVLDARARQLLGDPALSIFYHAPALVLVLAQADEPQAREDCCLAAQTFMLAARDAGLGTCWIGFGRPWLNLPETKAELGLPLQHHVVAPLVLGYPRSWPPPHGRQSPQIRWVG
jgi:nitroreductase